MSIDIKSMVSGSTQGSSMKGVDRSDTSGGNEKTSSTGNSQGDKVTLTGHAEKLRMMDEIVARTPVVDHQRVQQIKAAIADGSYSIDATKIATKLLAVEQQLSRK